jgi:molybdate transport system substrate-binding protein
MPLPALQGLARLAALPLLVVAVTAPAAARADRLTVAAAADLKFAMEEIVAAFRAANPGDEVEVVFGSSGRFHAQIQQGAPFDLFFSADIAFPRELARAGLAASEVTPYASGRLVLWSSTMDATRLTLASLADPGIRRIAIANPRHAPYGRRAEEALRASGLWEQVEPKLVYGENVSQAAQFVLSGNAQVGLVALSLAVGAELASRGGHRLVPAHLHAPLDQGYVITRRAAANPLARRFADFMGTAPARAVMVRYGFVLPGEPGGK